MTRSDPIHHDEAVELLPWLVNGSLDGNERDAVEAHALNCVICRRELDELRVVQQSVTSCGERIEIPGPDMRRINARIDIELERRSIAGYLQNCWQQLVASRLRVAFALQTLVLVFVAGLSISLPEPAAEFTTLSAPESLPEGHYLRVIFDPTLPEAEVDRIIKANRLSVVAGPSSRGVVTLQLPDFLTEPARRSILQGMQSDSRILFAQPVEGAR